MHAGKKRIRSESPVSSEGYNTEEEMIKQLGYGKSLYKSVEDEAYISSLKDLEREEILNERHEKMRNIQEKLKLLRDYRKTHKKSPLSPSNRHGALSDLKERREKRLTKTIRSSQSSSHSSSSAGMDKSEDSYSSGERSEDGGSEDKKRGISFVDLEKVRVSRGDLEKWVGEMFFEETIKGAFVRVNLGETEKGTSQYKIWEILGVKGATHAYTFGNRKLDKELVVRHGDAKRAFKMIVISNSKFEATEFSQWRSYCEKKGIPIPTFEQIEEIEARLKKTRNYSYSPNEINKIIEQNINQLIEKGSYDMNVTYIRTQIETQFKMAQSILEDNPDSLEAKELYNKMKVNLEKLNEIQRRKVEAQNQKNAAQNFNQRTHKLQIEEDMKRSELIKRKQKTSTEFDPFSTLACKPKILWNTNSEAPATPKVTSAPTPSLETSQAEPKKAKAEYKTDFEKALLRKEKIIETIKSIDLGIDHLISVDPNDFSKYPSFKRMPTLVDINPILKQKLQEKVQKEASKNKKVYTLEEYQKIFNV